MHQTEVPRPISLPASAIATLDEHRKRQDEFRRQYGLEYHADLDLIFANPDGSPFKPDSISAAAFTAVPPVEAAEGREPALPAPCPHLAPAG
jgi:hypothetical protein